MDPRFGESNKQPGADRSCNPPMANTKLDSELFNHMTEHQASFREYPCADRTQPVVQCVHEIVGNCQALMSNVTSQRHDYRAKYLRLKRATGPKDTIGAILSQDPTFMMDKGTETCSSHQQWEPQFRDPLIEEQPPTNEKRNDDKSAGLEAGPL
ncbi:unnamed protein product [Macrosiphum euphorbiae]|uniref:Uncharacterized protein n=1 Tax=Macrosiphum euphorbiae TaxID=13131 RepID=A0AAV0WUL1_9HEMI|nr:unnamed protein product [Macrosiphum euphorbiae]